MSAAETNSPPQRPWRYFEDLKIGERVRSRPYQVTAEEIIAFGRAYDPQFFHIDPEAARESLFGGLIASGLHVAALWRRLDHEVNGSIAWVCGLEWNEVRWRRAVRPGDTLVATSELLEKRPSRSRPGVGVVVLNHTLENEAGEIVFSFRSTALVYRRPADRP